MWEIFLLIFCLAVLVVPLVAARDTTNIAQSDEAGIKLHRPDGSPFFVNARTIGMVREPSTTENGNAVVVFSTGGTQATQETVQEIINMLTAEGAR